MVAIPTTAQLETANIDSLERLIVALGLYFSQQLGNLPSTSAVSKLVTVSLVQRPVFDQETLETVERATINFVCNFLLESDTQTDGGELLNNISPFLTASAPTFPVTPASLETQPALPTIPEELTTAEQLMVWALLSLSASLHPNSRDFIQINPKYGEGKLSINCQLPADRQALGLSGFQLIAGVQRIAAQYLELDTGAVAAINQDPYEIAVDEGWTGTRAEWLESLIGPPGETGPQGPQGEPGIDGADSTVPGPTGPQGETGPRSGLILSSVITDPWFLAEAGNHYLVDGVLTVTLPTDAVNGETIGFYDWGGKFSATPLVITAGGTDEIIEPGENQLRLNINFALIVLVYSDGLWSILSAQVFATVNGLDAYQLAQLEGYLGTRTEWLESLKAEVNLTPYALLNNPIFTGNELILPNNSRINAVEHFYQATRPSTRGNGDALVIGDKWWKTEDNGFIGTGNQWWWWNGTFWLSEVYFNPRFVVTSRTTAGNGTVNLTNPLPSPPWQDQIDLGANIGYTAYAIAYVPWVDYYINCPTADGSNYWLVGFSQSTFNGTSVVTSNWSTGIFTVNSSTVQKGRYNTNRLLGTGGSSTAQNINPSAVTSLVGTPGAIHISYSYHAYYLHPIPDLPI